MSVSRKRKKMFGKIAIMVALMMVTSLMLAGVSANSDNFPDAETVTGNPTGLISDQDFRFNTPVSDDYLWEDEDWQFCKEKNGLLVKFSILEDGLGNQYLEWWSNTPLTRVVVKGGNAASIYDYENVVTEDSGLYAPPNASGNPADISWLGFNFGEAPMVEFGSLVISKVVQDEEGETLDGFDPGHFSVRITGEGYDEEITLNDQINNLVPGGYCIEEINIPDGYKFVKFIVTGPGDGVVDPGGLNNDLEMDPCALHPNVVEVFVAANNTISVVVVNEKEDKEDNDDNGDEIGNLVITKNVYDEEGAEVADFDASAFKVKITYEDGTVIGQPTLDNASFDNLPAGKYTIEEIEDEMPDGFTLLGYIVGEGDVQETAEVTVVAGATVYVVVINEKEDKEDNDDNGDEIGNLVITKKVYNEEGAEVADFDASAFKVKITHEDGTVIGQPTLDNASFDNLPAGKYTIEEIDIPDGYYLAGYIKDGGDIRESATVEITVVAGAAGQVVVVNSEESEMEEPGDDPGEDPGDDNGDDDGDDDDITEDPELPKTGSAATLITLLGLAITGAGVLLRKRV